MNYILAIFIPPLSLLISRKIISAIISGIVFIVSLVTFVMGFGVLLHILNVIATCFIISKANTKRELNKLKKEIKEEVKKAA